MKQIEARENFHGRTRADPSRNGCSSWESGAFAALWLEDVDQPWYYCAFEPTPDFDEIRSRLEAMTQSVDADDLDGAEAIMDELHSLHLRLILPDGTREPRPDAEGSVMMDGHRIKLRPA